MFTGNRCDRKSFFANKKYEGNLLYNRRVVDSNEKFSLVLVDQYYFASYFPTIKEKEVTLLFPDLVRELVAKYLGKNGANWDKI